MVVAFGWGCGKKDERRSKPVARSDAATPGRHGKVAPVRLVVLIVVDQLPSWSFERDRGKTRAGLARLLRGGVYYKYARFPFAATATAPGHAALATGASPTQTGILANSWFRRGSGEVVSAVSDATSRVHVIGKPAKSTTKPGEEHRRGASAVQLQVDGIADTLRKSAKGAKSVAVALKSRAAILVLGKRPDLAIWYDPSQVAMTTSTYYAIEPPPWLVQLAKDKPITGRLADEWRPLDAEACAAHCAIPDTGPGEGNPYKLGNAFPHLLAEASKPERALRLTPTGTDIVLETAKAAIAGEGLGADDVADVLAISISSHDYAGHAWGQESWERFDLFMRMDQALGELMTHLDETIGKGRYAVVLTSDHGAIPMIEQSHARKLEAHRVFVPKIEAAAEAAAAKVLGKKGDWIVSVSAGTLYLSPRIPVARKSQVVAAVREAVATIPGIGYTAAVTDIHGDCDARKDAIEQMACRSVHPELSGEVFFAAGPRSLITTTYTTGTSHGSPNPEDTTVPIIVYHPSMKPKTVSEPVSTLDVATTVSVLLGVPGPAASSGRFLR